MYRTDEEFEYYRKKADEKEIREIERGDTDFPSCLTHMDSPPERIFVSGSLPDERRASVAVIGARRCSSYGKEMAEWFAGTLAREGIQIISGMALGIDGLAQRAALENGGKSYAVLGCGVDVCYPLQNKDIYERMRREGGLLSEYPPGSRPEAWHFPMRNRIISGLSDLILVIEAKHKSGTLITVDRALEQGRDVFVLPGRVTDPLSCGCNRLLKQGARIALEPGDILEALQMMGRIEGDGKGKGYQHPKASGRKMSARERSVWRLLENRPLDLQQIYEKQAGKGRITLPELIKTLMDLTFQGYAEQVEVNRYIRR